jgi:hypothetical protein
MTDLDVIQWLFDSEVFVKALNWPVHVDGLVAAKRELDACLLAREPAATVMDAYRKLSGAIGPSVMTVLLESDDAFPEVNHSGLPTPPSPGKVTLYVDVRGGRVMAETTKQWGMPPTFTLE